MAVCGLGCILCVYACVARGGKQGDRVCAGGMSIVLFPCLKEKSWASSFYYVYFDTFYTRQHLKGNSVFFVLSIVNKINLVTC